MFLFQRFLFVSEYQDRTTFMEPDLIVIDFYQNLFILFLNNPGEQAHS